MEQRCSVGCDIRVGFRKEECFILPKGGDRVGMWQSENHKHRVELGKAGNKEQDKSQAAIP